MINCSLGFHMHFDNGSEYGLGSSLDHGLMMLFLLIFSILYSLVLLEAIGTISKLCIVNEIKCFKKLMNLEIY